MNILKNYGMKRSTLDTLKQVSIYCKHFANCTSGCIYSKNAGPRCGIGWETPLNRFSPPDRNPPCWWEIKSIKLNTPPEDMPSLEKVGEALGKLTIEELVKYEIIDPD